MMPRIHVLPLGFTLPFSLSSLAPTTPTDHSDRPFRPTTPTCPTDLSDQPFRPTIPYPSLTNLFHCFVSFDLLSLHHS